MNSVVHRAARVISVALLVLWSLAALPARGESAVSPIAIAVPSTTYDLVGSATSPAKSYFAFTATAGTSYAIAPQRVVPSTGEIYGPASFIVSIYTNDASRTLVAYGSAWNLNAFITPPLQSGGYVIEINDQFVGYASITDYYLSIAVASTGGTPVGPVPNAAPIVVASLAPSAASVVGGTPLTLTVTLSAPAPVGGTSVALASNSSAVTVPASVTVPAGQTRAVVTVNTTAVRKSTPVTVTARTGSTTTSASFTVTR